MKYTGQDESFRGQYRDQAEKSVLREPRARSD